MLIQYYMLLEPIYIHFHVFIIFSDLSKDNSCKTPKKSSNGNKVIKRKKDSALQSPKENIGLKLESTTNASNKFDLSHSNGNIAGLPLDSHSSADSNCSTIGEQSGANESTNSNDKSKKKKARTTFTGRQIFELEKQFEIKKYLSSSERADMAKLLNVTETQVSLLLACHFSIG